MHNSSDIDLMLKAKAGDGSSFSELMRRHYKGVLNFIYRFTNKKELSEDLTQEVFLRVYRAAKNYKPEAKFTTWLYRIATNVCITEVKRTNSSSSLDEINENYGELNIGYSEESYEIIYRNQMKNIIFDALGSLSDNERTAIILCKYEGFSYDEVSEVIGCTVSAVKTYVYRGRIKLTEKLKKKFNEGEEYDQRT